MTESTPRPSRVLILGLDTFARKNVLQVRALEAEGYAFTIVTNDQRGESRRIFDEQGFAQSRLVIVRGTAEKLRTAWRLLREAGFQHVELSPAGRMGLLYLLMLKLLRRRFIVIERGDIGCIEDYGALVRFSLKLAYRWADCVVFKETYMEELLKRLTRAPLAFVPNSVERSPVESPAPREIDFLWANRIIPQRRPEWLVRAFADPALADRRLVLLGLEDRESLPGHIADLQERVRAQAPPNVELHGFVDPARYYGRARFFCLPSAIVFGNNALLEAMAAGLVPVVTEAPGVERIVEDGVNGIVTPLDEAAYRGGLARAAALSGEEWRRMSAQAVATVEEKYSVAAWTRKMVAVYRRFARD